MRSVLDRNLPSSVRIGQVEDGTIIIADRATSSRLATREYRSTSPPCRHRGARNQEERHRTLAGSCSGYRPTDKPSSSRPGTRADGRSAASHGESRSLTEPGTPGEALPVSGDGPIRRNRRPSPHPRRTREEDVCFAIAPFCYLTTTNFFISAR